MADSTISGLTAATALQDADLAAVVQGGTTKKATLAQIQARCLPRVRIPGLPALSVPIRPLGIAGDGSVIVDRDAASACREVNADLYANNSEWDGVTDQTTLDSWLQTRTESIARITSNTTITINNDQGLRNTHTSQSSGQRVKHLIADNCTVTIAIAPPATDIESLSYALDGSDVYLATMVDAAYPHRVFRTDATDAWGESEQMRKYSSLAALQAAGSGWFRSGTSLYVKLGSGVNVESQKAILAAKWRDTGGNSRLYVQGSIICMEGINGGAVLFDGIQILLAEVSSLKPQLWRQKVTQKWNAGVGVSAASPFGGTAVDSNCTIFSSELDGMNLSAASVNTGPGLMLTANNSFTDTGAIDTNGNNGSLQAISAHGGVNHVSYGLTATATNGPAVVDTAATGQNSVSWLVSCKSVDPSESLDRGFLFGSGSGGTRVAWLDQCVSEGATTDLTVDSFATVRKYEGSLPVITGATSIYDPLAPS